MGVKGLWSLLNPVARPVQIEHMEGKRLAIDSSIWLYQFQATMRDKDGRVLVNAHVLGFLRRINKLLFHGIKPVFVFDGGAPALKRSTIAERKRKKAGAAANHAKMAEKLFAAQMRREAVKAAQAAEEQRAARAVASSASRYPDEAGEQIAENAIYLEELEGRPGSSRPRPIERAPSVALPGEVPTDPEKRRKHFKKHDPYRLPEASMPLTSTADKPDARLATEEELKQFIDEVHPGDIDVESAEFRALPTEVQYEIIGDMRIRSRQQSHQRLANMLRAAPTALDFSMAQIKHLSQRNALTQQLLTVTDMVGKAHLTIPVRIAAERNREYVLVKRGEDEGGGWALGIREGTKEKPIVLEPEEPKVESESDSDSESDVEEVPHPQLAAMDADLKEHRRREVLEAIARRYAPLKPVRKSLDIAVKPFGKTRKPGSKPLFEAPEPEEEDEEEDDHLVIPTAHDEALALALQQEELGSDEDVVDEDLAKALALSRREKERKDRSQSTPESLDERLGDDDDEDMEEVSLVPSGRSTPVDLSRPTTPMTIEDDDDDEDDFEEVSTPPLPVTSTAKVTIARSSNGNAKPIEPIVTSAPIDTRPTTLHSNSKAQPSTTTAPAHTADRLTAASTKTLPVIDDETEEVQPISAPLSPPVLTSPNQSSPSTPVAKHSEPIVANSETRRDRPSPAEAVPPRPNIIARIPSATIKPSPLRMVTQPASSPITVSSPIEMDDFEEVVPPTAPSAVSHDVPHLFHASASEPFPHSSPVTAALSPGPNGATVRRTPSATPSDFFDASTEASSPAPLRRQDDSFDTDDEDEADDSRSIEWSASPPPIPRPALQPTDSASTIPSEVEEEDGDMAPADMAAEEDDYARFMAQIKGRNLDEVRTEIDDEIRVLNSANKVAMRDSDEITQSMIMQIQTLLRHFGIPYITAPMEAEAQCAKLAELGLVDGIITDDSDVFLFGGVQCFKNIFNDSKYAECFLSTDLDRELSLTRERLISLAYLLGSDYTIGLPGVGPVVALELLANFPGERGIQEFKEWWMKVQRGIDSESESGTKWRKTFKKRHGTSIYLTSDWPNPLVREAYLYPTTDESEEPFHWGFPKLSALRTFLHEELSWSISKVDDELTPIVQRIARRGKAGALNIQATLDPFFDTSLKTGNFAPRRRTTANVSKRLMAVFKQYREAEAFVKGQEVEGWGEMMKGLDEEDPKGRGTGKRRMSTSVSVKDDDEESLGGSSKKRKTSTAVRRKRTNTMSSVGTESVASSEGSGAGVKRAPGAASRGRGRGRGRAANPIASSETIVVDDE